MYNKRPHVPIANNPLRSFECNLRRRNDLNKLQSTSIYCLLKIALNHLRGEKKTVYQIEAAQQRVNNL